MTNKVYENIKNYIKENYKGLLFIIICFLLVTVKLPLYIEAPGGLINTAEKIDYSSNFKMKGSLNMAYVSQLSGTIPMLTYALINPNWDILKEKEITTGSESPEDTDYRNKILLKEANDIALLVAYKYSDINYRISNNEVYVTYVDELAKTNLKVGDRIVKIESKEVSKKQDLFDYIADKKIADKITFTVIRNDKQIKCNATLINVENTAKVGIVITETFDIKSDYHVDFNFKSSESGSSGGLMMSLSLYSYLKKQDLTSGKKIVGTGTIDSEGNVGEISGIKYKLIGAVKNKADIFLVPDGDNYKDAMKLKKEKKYDIKIVKVKTFDDALVYLKSL